MIDEKKLQESFNIIMDGIKEMENFKERVLENKKKSNERLRKLISIKVIADNSYYYGKDLSCLPVGTYIHLKLLNKDGNNYMVSAYHNENQIGYADFSNSDKDIILLKILFKENSYVIKEIVSYEKVLENKVNLILR